MKRSFYVKPRKFTTKCSSASSILFITYLSLRFSPFSLPPLSSTIPTRVSRIRLSMLLSLKILKLFDSRITRLEVLR
ncbi:hypothetical protein L2E82_05119 [Cichorium intybus]|uniref:Uncharacterized protein n=1 Tax=Cichorium intybus TaxID=13427 RepID=A0ACB9H7E1_CICIN|nr:hypothetical protein L2E82_05119 [Cichorium intybus]